MQVLSCAPAQDMDAEIYGESNEKDSWGTAIPLADPSISGQLPGRRQLFHNPDYGRFVGDPFEIAVRRDAILQNFGKHHFKALTSCGPEDTGLPGARSKDSRSGP